MNLRKLLFAALALTAFLPPTGAKADELYPDKSVRIVVTTAPGGLVDIFTRLFALELQGRLGKAFLIENRPGAGGIVAARTVIQAKPDGYTLLAITSAIHPAAMMQDPPPYGLGDLAPVALFVEGGSLLAVREGVAAKSIPELISYAKANPNKLTFGSSGFGGPIHLAIQQFMDLTGIEMKQIPYQSSASATLAMLQGEVDFTIVDGVAYARQIKEGQLRALAQTSEVRAKGYEDVEPLSTFVPGYSAPFWIGLAGPAGLPADIRAKLNAAVAAIVASGVIDKRAEMTGVATRNMAVAEFERYVIADAERWAATIKKNNIHTAQ